LLKVSIDPNYRIFYEVRLDEREVLVLAVGVEERNRLLIAGEEFES